MDSTGVRASVSPQGIERIHIVRSTSKSAAAIIASIGMLAGFQTSTRADDTQAMIAVGSAAPAVVGKSTNAGKTEEFDLFKAVSSGAVVLYFFPKAFTGGCSIEAKTYSAKLADFAKLGATVVGISTDPVDVLTKFQAAMGASQRFVSDPNGAIAQAYGVSFAYDGAVLAKRVTFVVGKDDKVLYSLAEDSPLTNVQSTLDWLKKNPQM
ncbi:MAG TPA: redoxin domain-containing protein [Candidatus Eremiobacteraceae bacterium]